MEMTGMFSKQAPDNSNVTDEHENLVDVETPGINITETVEIPEDMTSVEEANITTQNELSLDKLIVNNAERLFSPESTNGLDNMKAENGEEFPHQKADQNDSNPLLG